MRSKHIQTQFASKLNLNNEGKTIEYKLTDELGIPLRKEDLYVPYFGEKCMKCGNRMICNGCSKCGKCIN